MKPQYRVSKDNQLIVSRGQSRFEARGYFSIANGNELVYIVTEPAGWRRRYGVGRRIAFQGVWQMDSNHNLVFKLKKTNIQTGKERLVLKTQLRQAEKDALVFSLGTQGQKGTYAFRSLRLRGRWQADKYNRLQFLIKRLRGSADALTFSGSWQVKHNTLIYTYKKISLKTKTKRIQVLRFQGYWEISRPSRLTYILDAKNNSAFDFRAYVETPNLIGKRGVIKYRVGIGIRGSALFETQTVSLYGVWKLHRKGGLSLVMDYAGGRVKEIRFSAFVRVKPGNKITLDLRNRAGNDLGVSLTLTQSFFKNEAEWFLRMTADKKHPRFEWGLAVPW